MESCVVCSSKRNLKRCSRCKKVAYCCRDHQKQDWRIHKTVCKSSHGTLINVTQAPAHAVTHYDDNDGFRRLDNEDDQNRDSNRPISKFMGDSELAHKEEMESILDFTDLKASDKALIESNANIETKENNSKDIFDASDCAENVEEVSNETSIPDNNESTFINSVESTEDPQRNQSDRHASTDVENNDPNANGPNDSDDFTPFDTRPLRKLKFPKPESYTTKDLGEFVALRLINLGYCVIDGVFEDSIIDGLRNEMITLLSKDELKTGQIAGGATSSDDSQKITNSHIRSDKIKWLQGNERNLPNATNVLSKMDCIIDALSRHQYMTRYGKIHGRTKAMLACYPGNGTFYRRHIDNPYKDGRRITCILYVNKDWDVAKDGGLLRIFPLNQDKTVDIPPIANRLLFFWSDRRNPHEVQPAFKDRLALTVWYFEAKEREEAKFAELKQETDSINNHIERLEQQRKELVEQTKALTIHNKAMEAVKSLSSEELQAITFLVQNHPDPREVLSGMGISEAIQDALIEYINSQSE